MYLKALSVIAASLLIAGCSVKIQPYYSEASEVYHSSSISTKVFGIAGSNEELSYPAEFGVVHAIDNEKIEYTLIVPTHDGKKSKGDPSLSLYNFHHAAFLSKETLVEFIAAVDDAVADWNIVYAPNEAHNISYLSGSEKSSVDFHYQNGASGEVAFVDINSGEEFEKVNDDDSISVAIKVYHYEIRDLDELQGFSYLLHKAQDEYSSEIVPTLDSNVTSVESNVTAIIVSDDLNVSEPEENNVTAVVTPDDLNVSEPQENNTTEALEDKVPVVESNSSVTP